LKPFVADRADEKLIMPHLGEVLRSAASVRIGTVAASYTL